MPKGVSSMVRDPVCGLEVEGFEYPEIEEYNGRQYYFTGLQCAQEFRRDPEKYAAGHEEEFGVPVPDYTRKS
jgi:YHS domain-containing protein